MARKKSPAVPPKKPRNVPAKNLADPRYRHKVEEKPGAYSRKSRNQPGRAERFAPPETDES